MTWYEYVEHALLDAPLSGVSKDNYRRFLHEFEMWYRVARGVEPAPSDITQDVIDAWRGVLSLQLAESSVNARTSALRMMLGEFLGC